MDSFEKDIYDNTVSDSKEESIAKAIETMMEDIKNNQKVQIISRPKVSVLKGLIPIILFIGSYIFILVNSYSISGYISLKISQVVILTTIIYFIFLCLFLKRLLIWAILLYQRFAPEKIRKLCSFEPSCSEYMKLSIEKYGVIRGVYKGLHRLSRCHWPNGGVDYP